MGGYTMASTRERLSAHSIPARCHYRSVAEPINRYRGLNLDERDGAIWAFSPTAQTTERLLERH